MAREPKQMMLPGFDERVVHRKSPCDCEQTTVVIEIDGQRVTLVKQAGRLSLVRPESPRWPAR